MAICCIWPASAVAQRRITPINTKATATQPINELENDTARINAKMRATMVHYHDANGNIIYVDTITGREWRDSTAMNSIKKVMQYPLLESVSIGVDVWNPVMRAFGQKYGLIDFSAQLSLHNRFKPVFETGLGIAKDTPADNNYTYKTPLSWYFRLGMDYNFLYNSSSDYQFLTGLRLGVSPFSYTLENITIGNGYWGEDARFDMPSIRTTAVWMEFAVGLKVKLWGPISAGWMFRYHSVLRESKSEYGKPWYIPGYGSRNGSITGSFTLSYTLPLSKKKPVETYELDMPRDIYMPESSGEPTPEQIDEGLDAQNPE